jgi:hypothetical protein
MMNLKTIKCTFESIIRRYKLLIFIGFLITFPIILNWLLYYDFPPTPPDLDNSNWLSFWGSFMGGIATIIAVYLTLTQNFKFQKERDRLNVLPYINLSILNDEKVEQTYKAPSGHLIINGDTFNYECTLPKKYEILKDFNIIRIEKSPDSICHILLEVKNIGIQTAINVNTSLINKEEKCIKGKFIDYNLPLDNRIIISTIFPKKSDEYTLKFKYNDIYNKYTYTNSFKIKTKYDETSNITELGIFLITEQKFVENNTKRK